MTPKLRSTGKRKAAEAEAGPEDNGSQARKFVKLPSKATKPVLNTLMSAAKRQTLAKAEELSPAPATRSRRQPQRTRRQTTIEPEAGEDVSASRKCAASFHGEKIRSKLTSLFLQLRLLLPGLCQQKGRKKRRGGLAAPVSKRLRPQRHLMSLQRVSFDGAINTREQAQYLPARAQV